MTLNTTCEQKRRWTEWISLSIVDSGECDKQRETNAYKTTGKCGFRANSLSETEECAQE